MPIFRFCFVLFVYGLKKFYLFLEYRQTLFSSLFCLKNEKIEKVQFFDQNHGQ